MRLMNVNGSDDVIKGRIKGRWNELLLMSDTKYVWINRKRVRRISIVFFFRIFRISFSMILDESRKGNHSHFFM